jgi:hypothetical protein
MSNCNTLLCAILGWSLLATNGMSQDDRSFTALRIEADSVGDLSFELLDKDVHQFITSGSDPHVFTSPLEDRLPGNHVVLSFEYFCPKGLDHLHVWFGPPWDQQHSKLVRRIGMSEGWVSYALDLSEDIGDWGEPGDFLRLDLGGRPDVNLQIRNLQLRPMSPREKEIAATREEKKKRDAILHRNLETYLAADYPSSIDKIIVTREKINIIGSASSTDQVYLCEVPPYMDVTEEQKFETAVNIKESNFVVDQDRFENRDGIRYDKILSKWVLAHKTADGYRLISHARYADEMQSEFDLVDEKPTSKKGLGGFSTSRGHVGDLEDLDITSATVNIWFTRFMHTKPGPDRMEHSYNGKSYYFEKEAVEGFDETFRTCAEHNIIVAAILLVDKQERCPDPQIGSLLQHPDMDPAGIYSMPNMTTPESVDCYAAALDFLASRYSRPDKKYGRIHHWIMHNEVDAGWVWTNMGEKTDLVFMDAYLKSMRMCYYIARKYNPLSEVFITLTHYWAWTSHPNFYPSKDLLEILIAYTKAEGDFEWGVAHHPYPESLFEPKTWLDQKVQFDFNTPLITFKNIEVINAWIKLPEVLYQGKQKRTLWLSENGTNSKSYSEQDLKEQAAGFAYTWKKLKTLDGIDGFQWHNWFDSRGEGGLRIGLRRFPDDEEDPGGRKPVWFVYQAADAENEDEVFDPYKELIGIAEWDQLIYLGEIDQQKKHATARNIMSDTWVATDALGRGLPGYAECGPLKGKRYVGMFYFMTHRNPGGRGPFDVTKIKAANPENPQWGDGSHYWGEPEIGYYLNTEEWAIRRHAYQLADAGVDVIIFDVTNNSTFPDVYLPVCKVWRQMRAEGERTPDIAFLGSEISVNTLWDEFYEKGMFPDLWFYWKGKPLLLYGQHEQPQRNKINDIVFRDDILDFFSLRQSWAWTSLPWYDDGHDEWPWVDHFPQTIGWHEDPAIAENVPVAVGQHPLSNIGRSFHQFHQPETDKYDLTPLTDHGMHFQEQWDRAHEVDPEFVFVTGWNEWTAGAQVMKEPIIPNLLKWDFYPGAHLGRAGKPIKLGDKYFIDQYNQEYSRDIEPMVGGHTDNYYYQLIHNVRKYKGVQKPPAAGEMVTIDLAAGFDQWKKVPATYYDHIGDVAHRNSPGQGQAGPYVNTTGRNDIVESKVARDAENIYFYVKTNGDLTSHADANWMLLYIDADQDKATGWEGYDYLVNSETGSARSTTLKAWKKDDWGKAVEISYMYSGNELMISIPRERLGEEVVSIDFHWADNIQQLNDIKEFFVNGDNAPERRSNYRYAE